MSARMIVDLHLDLAWDALYWNRDLTLTPQEIRAREKAEPPQVADDVDVGRCTVTFPELRKGNVGLILSTIMSRIQSRDGHMRDGHRTQEQAMATGRGHLAYYQTMAKRGELKPVLGLEELEEAARVWSQAVNADGAAVRDNAPVYHVLSMESADPIDGPDDVQFWWDAGLRVVGPAHFGDNTYIHGTGTEGGLKEPAVALYRAMAEAGIVLDVTHMADQAVWESLDLWDGPIMASHCTCRSIVPGQRHLTDEMITELCQRDAVIGLVFCQFFIDPEIDWAQRRAWVKEGAVSKCQMDALLPHVERIGELAGGTLANVAIGTDMDGGFGAELTPTDVDTIADLQGFAGVLTGAGYKEQTVTGILGGNALRLFRNAWSQ